MIDYVALIAKKQAQNPFLPIHTLVRFILQTEILTCEREPSERLKEIELAEQMGVSRTTIRNALEELIEQGLAQRNKNRGVRVSGVSRKKFLQIFEYRRQMEPFAGKLAAARRTVRDLEELRRCLELSHTLDPKVFGRADSDFHRAICAASKNEYLLQTYNMIDAERVRVNYYATGETHRNMLERKDMFLEGHFLIYEAIQNADGETACRLIKEHTNSMLHNLDKELRVRLQVQNELSSGKPMSECKTILQQRQDADPLLPIHTVARNLIQDAILTCRLLPGQRLKEVELAKETGVSRTTIRNALEVLEIMGLVERGKSYGVRVVSVSKRQHWQLYEYRRQMEPFAGRLAAIRRTARDLTELERCIAFSKTDDPRAFALADSEFHRAVCAASKNEYLLQAYELINRDRARYNYFTVEDMSEKRQEKKKLILESHIQIYRAIRSSDESATYSLIREHANFMQFDFERMVQARLSKI